MTPIYYVNGEFVAAHQAALALNDLGLVRGYGVFDYLRTYGGKPFKLTEHVQRLATSAQAIGLALPGSVREIAAIAQETYQRNGLAEAGIRIIATGGVSDNFMLPQGQPTLAVLVTPLAPGAPPEQASGVKLLSVSMERFMPTVKSINYIGAIMATQQAKAVGAAEALYRDGAGFVSECTRSNFFAFRGRQLITPQKDVLAGITKAVVMELADDDFDVVEGPLHYDELASCDEAFITSTTKEILPVVQIDEQRVGSGQPGAKTQKLIQLFRTHTEIF
jgi:branched-chain amino acid aminotransferase